jgi:hypothetical protein
VEYILWSCIVQYILRGLHSEVHSMELHSAVYFEGTA